MTDSVNQQGTFINAGFAPAHQTSFNHSQRVRQFEPEKQAADMPQKSAYSALSRWPADPITQSGGSVVNTQNTRAYENRVPEQAWHSGSPSPASVENPTSHVNFPFSKPALQQSFPAAPSKVLEEQIATGGTGHIPSSSENPHHKFQRAAPEMSASSTNRTLLEGLYPYPQDQMLRQQSQSDFPRNHEASSIHSRPLPEARSETQMEAETTGGWTEPSMVESHGTQDYAQTAQGSYDAASHISDQMLRGRKTSWSRTKWGLALGLSSAISLMAFFVYSQSTNSQASPGSLRVAAPDGAERSRPADPGGLKIPGDELIVLDPQKRIAVNQNLVSNLDPNTRSNNADTSFPRTLINSDISDVSGSDIQIIEEIEVPPRPKSNFAAAPQSSGLEPVANSDSLVSVAIDMGEASSPNQINLQGTPQVTQEDVKAQEALGDSRPQQTEAVSLLSAIPSGLYVQEGAYGTLTRAQTAYEALLRAAPSDMAGLKPSYHQIEINGRTWVRLYLTGFDSKINARQMGTNLGRSSSQWLVFNG